ncbi:MAG: sulfatase [Armatimonadota bacterium]|nr:MAG: sulfatase [Armatimonadota bacterium]
MRRARWLWVLIPVLGIGGWLLVGRSDVRQPAAAPVRAARFLLIVSDSLRADHVGCYGSAKGLTPNIDAFAKRAARFDNAYAASSWTCPSNAALMTGKYPREVQQRNAMRLAANAVTMAECFRDAGYATAGFSSHLLMSGRYGFDQGFQSFACKRLQDDEMADRCIQWMSAHAEEPFFVLLYLLDPHWPYDPEAAGASRVPPKADVRERVAEGYSPLDAEVRVPRIVKRPRGDEEMSLDEVEYLHALYDGDVASVDARIGRVLRAASGFEDLAVVVAADHGEEWLDHGGLSHLYTLYDELLDIPLIMSVPGQQPRVVSAPVSNLDVLPTLLGLADIERPEGLRGINLLPLDKLPARRALAAEVHGWNPCGVSRYGVRLDDQTLICTMAGLSDEPKPPPRGRFERYNYVEDPRQQRPLPLNDPKSDYLWRLMRASNPFAALARAGDQRPKLDAKTTEELRSIGYVGK